MCRIGRHIGLTVAVLAGSSALWAGNRFDLQSQPDPELTAILRTMREKGGIPGVGAAIVRNQRVSVAVAGNRRADQDAPLSVEDRFHLGSDTKAMTASVAARLVDRGILRWNETLAEAMPDAAFDPAFRPVTLDMLMRHIAGLQESGAFTPEFTKGFDDTWPIARQRTWMANRFVSRPPKYTPGTRFAYSNYNFLILGHVMERATGKTWEELVRREVFEPLGITGCGFGPTATAASPRGNWGHDRKDGRYIPTEEDNPPLIGPAGTINCTLESWARFAAAHSRPEQGSWISTKSMNHLHEPLHIAGTTPGKDIALGWGVALTNPPRLTHSGSNGYNVAEIIVVPATRSAVLVTCNAGDDSAMKGCEEIRDRLAQKYLGAAKLNQ